MLVCSALVILTACQQAKQPPTAAQGPNELAWARGALDRNPNLEVVATDTQAGVFTVRDRTTGEVHAVKASELAAVPLSQLAAPAHAASATAKEPEASRASTAPSTSAPNDSTTAPQAAATASDTAAQSASTGPHPYTIERSAGQLKVSGPGISIVSSGAPGAAQAAAAQRKADPIICEGQRRIQLDGRDIQVDGDAVTARAGCELYITNSRIVASGTGVVVQDAVVHIANSYIEGASGSIAAEGGSRMFLRGSTFNGLQRRDSLASVQDQGGNQWR
jgi:hypothetical protein